MQLIEEEFEYIVFSANDTKQSVVESIKDEINKEHSFQELHIQPFFAKRRNRLVRNICLLNSSYNDEEIERVNGLIDSLVQNNSSLFSLNPGFIIRYTNSLSRNVIMIIVKVKQFSAKCLNTNYIESIIEFKKLTSMKLWSYSRI